MEFCFIATANFYVTNQYLLVDNYQMEMALRFGLKSLSPSKRVSSSSIRLSIHFLVPAAEKHVYRLMLPLPCFTLGMVCV